jgi:hypothetical protein
MFRLSIRHSVEVTVVAAFLLARVGASPPPPIAPLPAAEASESTDLPGLPWSDREAKPLIQVRPISPDGHFQDSTATEALNFACASDPTQLRVFFEAQALPFKLDLVRKIKGKKCHIYYQATIQGFRADPDDFPVERLMFDYATIRFLAQESFLFGDTLDIIRSVSNQLELPPTFHITLQGLNTDRLFDKVKTLYFGNKADQVSLKSRRGDSHVAWAQDYVKSGRVETERLVLVPHQIYEGKSESAEQFRGLLDTLLEDEEDFKSSHLSWEGGDLQFTLHPRDPKKLVLFYGNGAKDYWGKGLTPAEYAYVLKQEFGADLAVDLSDMAPHVDYFVSFLPAERIALVSEPLDSDLPVALDALRSLIKRFERTSSPPKELLELLSLLVTQDGSKKGEISRLMDRIWEVQGEWSLGFDSAVMGRVSSYVSHSCSSETSQCLSLEGQIKLVHEDLPLLKDWVRVALDIKSERQLIVSHLAIIESQFAKPQKKRRKQLEEKIGLLEELGFRVVRVPRISGTSPIGAAWPGISYVNGLLIDKTFFVPKFGLGDSEDRLLKRLASQLPDSYTLVPVYSQHSLLHNGGIHCIAGILRGLPGSVRSNLTTKASKLTTGVERSLFGVDELPAF